MKSRSKSPSHIAHNTMWLIHPNDKNPLFGGSSTYSPGVWMSRELMIFPHFAGFSFSQTYWICCLIFVAQNLLHDAPSNQNHQNGSCLPTLHPAQLLQFDAFCFHKIKTCSYWCWNFNLELNLELHPNTEVWRFLFVVKFQFWQNVFFWVL